MQTFFYESASVVRKNIENEGSDVVGGVAPSDPVTRVHGGGCAPALETYGIEAEEQKSQLGMSRNVALVVRGGPPPLSAKRHDAPQRPSGLGVGSFLWCCQIPTSKWLTDAQAPPIQT